MMKYKLWTVPVLALLAILLCCVSSLAETSGYCGDSVSWKLTDDGTLTISGTGSTFDYSSGSPGWYSQRSSVKKIVVKNGVVRIGDYLFYNLQKAASITLPDSVKKIGSDAFEYCDSLTEVTLSKYVTEIGTRAFSDCTRLKDVSIFSRNVYIASKAFSGCPDSLTVHCWAGSTAETYLEAVGITFSAWQSSGQCGSDVTWSLNDSLTVLTLRGSGGTWSYSDEYPGFYTAKDRIISVKIEKGITALGNYLFYDLEKLQKADIPSSVTEIGSYAFAYCADMVQVYLPCRLASLGTRAFYKCSRLCDASFCNSGTVIGEEAFLDCSESLLLHGYADSTAQACADGSGYRFTAWSLSGQCGSSVNWSFNPGTETLTISGDGSTEDYSGGKAGWYPIRGGILHASVHSGVTTIGSSLFYGCTELQSVYIHDSVTSIGEKAFYNCSSLESVTVPRSVTSVGDSAFRLASSLAEVIFRHPYVTFGSNVFTSGSTALVIHGWAESGIQQYAENQGISFQPIEPDFFLPAGLTKIDEEVFRGIQAEAVVIPKTVTSIYGNPFQGSSVRVIYGCAGSRAESFASDIRCSFIPVSDAWMAGH